MLSDQVFMLLDVSNKEIKAVALVPYLISADRVQKAWSYALKYCPASLHEADYEKAIKVMMSRHPRWAVALRVQRELTIVAYDPKKASQDVSEDGSR